MLLKNSGEFKKTCSKSNFENSITCLQYKKSTKKSKSANSEPYTSTQLCLKQYKSLNSSKFTVPDTPYNRDDPNKNRQEANAPKIKYLTPEFTEKVDCLLKDAEALHLKSRNFCLREYNV